jgi:hypothetical protein
MLKVAFGEQKVGGTQLFDWFSKFKCSMTSLEGSEYFEYPLMSKIGETGSSEGACL